ncbi:MAG: hypothetical protein L0221_14760, partial [Chloroflexi bacterium]|nr:hypothetical protein [Chloroflexota bacterium]
EGVRHGSEATRFARAGSSEPEPRAPREEPSRGTVDPSPRAEPAATDRPRAERERLRLGCRGIVEPERRGIACMWSESAHPDFAGYVLWRGDGETRTVVFRTRDRSHTRFLDTGVRPGVTYMYAVHVLDESGEVIGSGGPVRARVEPRREELRLACAGHEEGIACRWSPSQHRDFAGYVLRRGDGESRTVVFRTRDRSHTRFLDNDVRRDVAYVYAIEVVDADGEVIGSGGPVRARAPGEPRRAAPRDGDRPAG